MVIYAFSFYMKNISKLKFRTNKILNKKGFSFIEVLVATAMLIIATAILAGSLTYPLQNQFNAENAFRAVFLAQEKAEELKATSWNQLVSEPETEITGYQHFKRSVNIKNLNSYTKQITIRVSYPMYSNKSGVLTIVFERTVDF